jgi:hypothetical protein
MAKNGLGCAIVIGFIGLAVAAGGCGDNGSNELEGFVGTWQYTESAATLSCPGQTDQTGTLGSKKNWGEGVSSDLVDLGTSVIDGSTFCDYTFDVKDKIASIKLGQTCTLTDVTGAAFLEEPSSWVFSLLSPTTAEETMMTVIDSDCSFIGSAKLKKISKD